MSEEQAAAEWAARAATTIAPPSNEVVRPGEVPDQQEAAGPPTHAIWREDSVEFVSPAGYDPANLTELPEGFEPDWMRPDFETRSFVFDAERLDAQLHAQIDAGAGAFRSRFITDIPGQQMIYLTKEAEARAILAGGDPAEAELIVGGAEARGIEPVEMAAIVVARADQLRMLGRATEIRREAAKATVTAAATVAGKMAAAAVDWDALLEPSPAP